MSSSELSDHPVEADAPADTANKRRSGRVSRKPPQFAQAPTRPKRKRAEAEEDGVADGQEADEDDEEESESEASADEEEVRERRAKARKTKAAPTTKKPAAKRPKTNGVTLALPVRSQVKGRRKRAQAVDEEDAEQAGGLYGQSKTLPTRAPSQHMLTKCTAEVFARGHTLHDVAAEWLQAFEQHESAAVAQLVNFVLRCSGCDLNVTEHDIEDPDNCTGKMEDLQGEFQAVSPALPIPLSPRPPSTDRIPA